MDDKLAFVSGIPQLVGVQVHLYLKSDMLHQESR